MNNKYLGNNSYSKPSIVSTNSLRGSQWKSTSKAAKSSVQSSLLAPKTLNRIDKPFSILGIRDAVKRRLKAKQELVSTNDSSSASNGSISNFRLEPWKTKVKVIRRDSDMDRASFMDHDGDNLLTIKTSDLKSALPHNSRRRNLTPQTQNSRFGFKNPLAFKNKKSINKYNSGKSQYQSQISKNVEELTFGVTNSEPTTLSSNKRVFSNELPIYNYFKSKSTTTMDITPVLAASSKRSRDDESDYYQPLSKIRRGNSFNCKTSENSSSPTDDHSSTTTTNSSPVEESTPDTDSFNDVDQYKIATDYDNSNGSRFISKYLPTVNSTSKIRSIPFNRTRPYVSRSVENFSHSSNDANYNPRHRAQSITIGENPIKQVPVKFKSDERDSLGLPTVRFKDKAQVLLYNKEFELRPTKSSFNPFRSSPGSDVKYSQSENTSTNSILKKTVNRNSITESLLAQEAELIDLNEFLYKFESAEALRGRTEPYSHIMRGHQIQLYNDYIKQKY